VHGIANAPERPVGQPAALAQLVNQQDEDVEISHAAKAPRQLPKPAAEFPHNGLFEPEDREKLAEAPGRDPGAVHGADLARLDTG
jgi:hypothetical protein